jgi:phosphatidylinositol alpha-1,6-mannosyltransferase
MAEVLLVSKPVGPPWNDSTKNLVRDLAWSMERHRPVVLARRGADGGPPRGRVERIYRRSAGGFAPAVADNAFVLLRLLAGRRADVWHFFFAPNRRTSAAGRVAARVRRPPTVHTIASAPAAGEELRAVLFADVNVVLSRHTEARMRDGGLEVRRIAPGIEPLPAPTEEARRAARRDLGLPEDGPLLVYPGDLEFGRGASVVLDAFAELDGDEHLVMACRNKTAAAREVEGRLHAGAATRGLDRRVSWIGETARIHALLAAADVVLLPSESLYAKMDYPLVLLEAMSLGRPVVVARATPAAELGEHGAVVVDPTPDAVAAAVKRLLDDTALRSRLGEEGRRAVETTFHRRTMAAAYESLYDELV